MKKFILPFLFILLSSSLHARVVYLAEGLKVDLDNVRGITATCDGQQTPGEKCLYQCWKVENTTSSNAFSCDLQGTAKFHEEIPQEQGSPFYPILFTGNTLVATDYRSVVVYPYQTVEVCFNYGKETVSAPNQPVARWAIDYGNITTTSGQPCEGTVGIIQ